MKVLKMQRNSSNCIICGMENPLGLQAPFYQLDDGSVASVFTYKPEHQSYPARTHGGMITALLDELMGRALWIDEPDMFGVTTSLSVTFRKPVPFGVKLKARAYITFKSKIGFSAKGELFDMNNNLLAEGTSKYLKLPPEKAFDSNEHADAEMRYTMPMDLTEIDFPEITKE